MCNSATISDKTLPKSKEGDEVEVKVRGMIVEEDGMRKIEISHVEGKPVGSMEECGSCQGKPHHGGEMPDAHDALITFMKVIKPRNK